MEKVVNYIGKYLTGAAFSAWAVFQPTIPFTLLCFLAVIIDCYSAWRLAKRIKRNHPEYPETYVHDKIESDRLKKIFPTMLEIASLILLLKGMDDVCFPFADLYLANWIAGVFCGVQVWSILENASSENGASWARVFQKIMINKASRHVDNLSEILDDIKNKEKQGEDHNSDV